MRLLLLLFALFLSHPAMAAEPAGLEEIGPVDEDRYLDLIKELRCLVCQNQSLADSHADLAKDMREEVRRKMASGASDQEIVDYLVARYGDFVRYRPPLKATTVLLWFGPALLVVAGAVVLVARTRRRAAPAPLTEEERRKAEALLAGDEQDKG